jgi:hypothetical protein
MQIDRDSLQRLEIDGLTPLQLKLAVESLFGPEPDSQLKSKLAPIRRTLALQRLWQTYAGERAPELHGEPYRFTHSTLLRLAELRRPTRIGNTVTDFSKWVLSLYFDIQDRSGLAYGKQVERDVARLAPPPEHADWELVYRDPLTEKPTALEISALTANGGSLWGAPDLVFRHRRSGEIVIIERKASNREIPVNGWPNAKAQLWAYAQIDLWRDATRKSLVMEVWGHAGNRLVRRHINRWVSSDPVFHGEQTELFSRYRGDGLAGTAAVGT